MKSEATVRSGKIKRMRKDIPMKQELPKRQLGQTDMVVTQLGYGSMGLRGPNTWGVRVVEDEAADQFLNLVLDSGINFIDTAPDYGVAEERIGNAISHRRSEYFLATKCGCDYVQHEDHIEIAHRWEKEVVEKNVTTSLQRLKTDTIDLLQFHGGDATTLVESGLIDQLVNLKRQGVIRYLGVSSKLPNLDALIELKVFDTFQIPYSCLAPEHDRLLLKAKDAGAGVIIRGGVAHGGPDAEIQRPQLNEVWEAAKLDEIVPEGMARAEFILRNTLSHPACDTTIVGTCNSEHLSENIATAQKDVHPTELRNEVTNRVSIALNDR